MRQHNITHLILETNMSLELDLVSQIMYLQEGEIIGGDEKKVEHYEREIANWQHEVINSKMNMPLMKQEILEALFQVENNFEG
jgi:hypothetical protein